jgi:serine O-acetyltransferase
MEQAMATGLRKTPKTLGLFALFAEDLRAWKRIGFLGGGASQQQPVTLMEALKLYWNYTGVRATWVYRLGNWCHRHHVPLLPGLLWRRNIRRFGLDIVPTVPIGPGLYIAHPVGIVVMARGLGRNVSLISAITIGMRNDHQFPLIGNDVTIGAGARVLGGIVVGDGAKIGANAVVIDDVLPGATMVGIPAKQVGRKTSSPLQQVEEILHGS